MKRIQLAMYGILIIFTFSCKQNSDEAMQLYNYEEYIEYFIETDTLIDKNRLKGWSVESRDDYPCYVLKYDTSTSMNPLYKIGDYYYINCYDINTRKPLYDYVNDTIILCHFWGIEKDSFQLYIESICNNLKKVFGNYKINKLIFSKNNSIVFISEYNGWSLFYMGDSLNYTIYRKMLDKGGYRQLDSSFFWVREYCDSAKGIIN